MASFWPILVPCPTGLRRLCHGHFQLTPGLRNEDAEFVALVNFHDNNDHTGVQRRNVVNSRLFFSISTHHNHEHYDLHLHFYSTVVEQKSAKYTRRMSTVNACLPPRVPAPTLDDHLLVAVFPAIWIRGWLGEAHLALTPHPNYSQNISHGMHPASP